MEHLTVGTKNRHAGVATVTWTHVCDQRHPDCVAAAYYSNSKNLRPHGPGHRRKDR